MGRQRVTLVGDMTTTGGKIITGENSVRSEGMATALVGNKAFCPKCNKTGTIIEGCQIFTVEGKSATYNGCLITCGCPIGTNCIIAESSFIFIDDSNTPYTIPVLADTKQSNGSAAQMNSSLNSSLNLSFASNLTNLNDTQQNRIRFDAKELCDKHFYYPEIKQAFMDDITAFAQQIVAEVESGQKSYEQGRDELKKEEKILFFKLWNGLLAAYQF